MKKVCRHCGKLIEHDSPQQLGGHLTNCSQNPKRKEITKKASESRRVERKSYKFNCLKCGREYVINLKVTDFQKGKYPKNCSRKCANSKKHSKETKEKMSKSIINYIEKNGAFGCLIKQCLLKREKKKCKICDSKLTYSHV